MLRGFGTGICVLDPDLRIRYTNDWYVKAFGDDTGKYYYELFGYKPAIHDRILKSFEDDKPITVLQTVHDMNGRMFDVTLSVIPLADSSDTRFAAIEVVQDVTSHAEIAEIDNKIKSLLSEVGTDCADYSDYADSISFGIFIRNKEGEIASVDLLNTATESDLAQEMPDMRDVQEMNVIGPPSVLFGRFEERSTSPVDVSGLSEITEELAQSNLELASIIKSRDDVLNTVSHELRNPMTAIHAYAELLHDEKLGEINEKQESALLKIIRNSDRIIVLVSDMLDISKIRSGKMFLNVSSIDINEMIDEITDNMRSLADEKNIHLSSDLPDHSDLPEVKLDSNLMTRVLINLLDNAIKFTPEEGNVTIAVRDCKSTIEISVSDNGIGIPEESLASIFEEFSQAKYHKGTGLGLAIAKKIVEMHHGLLEVTSVEGRGSTFTIILPKGD